MGLNQAVWGPTAIKEGRVESAVCAREEETTFARFS